MIKLNTKKGVAVITLLSLCFSPSSAFGNTQKPLDSDGIVNINLKNNKVNSSSSIVSSPNVSVEWKEAPLNDIGSQPGTGGENDTHKTEYYKFELLDLAKKDILPTLSSPIKNKLIENIENVTSLRSGALYRLRVVPIHNHTIKDDDKTYSKEILGTGGPEKYFITDFDTKIQDKDGNLEINFEYIPGASYEVLYVEGDFSTAEEITSGFPKKLVITDEEAKKNLYIENGIERVRYEIKGVSQGQLYSLFVRVKDMKNNNAPQLSKIYQNKNLDKLGPKVVKATTSISLQVLGIGAERIRLEWKIAPWATLNSSLIRTDILARNAGKGDYNIIGSINNESISGVDMEFFESNEPKDKTYYKVEFILKSKDGEIIKISTDENLYTPYEIRENPLNPKIPMFFDFNTQIDESQKSDYLVSGDKIDFTNIDLKNHTFHGETKNKNHSIYIVWDAPLLSDKQVDYGLTYDIWVSDNKKVIEDLEQPPLMKDIYINKGDANKTINFEGKTVGFKEEILSYINSKREIKSLESNKTYYIKMVAKKWYGDEFTTSTPTLTQATLPVTEEIFTPPVMGKPPLASDNITSTTAKMYWKETWHEIISKNPNIYSGEEIEIAQQWQPIVYIGNAKDPYVSFIPKSNLTPILLTEQAMVDQVENFVNKQSGQSDYYKENYFDRKVNLGGVNYEIKLIPYSELDLKKQKIENWIIENESNSIIGWEEISSTKESYKGTNWQSYQLSNLKPNTRYLIMLRSFKLMENGDKKIQSFPSYVIITTDSDFNSLEETPKVPLLKLDKISDTSFTVKWDYNKSFDYELIYSKTENIENAQTVDIDFNNIENEKEVSIDIKGLFPDTTYYAWVRAKQKKGTEVSKWSTPITAKTKSIESPDVPTGLGLASSQSLVDLEINEKSQGEDYLIIEWNKDLKDISNLIEDKFKKEYLYEVEFADNINFLDSKKVLISDEIKGTDEKEYEILDKNIVKFMNLEANKIHYVKVKSILQVSDSESNRTISASSDFSNTVKISTKASDKEYDGGLNENIIVYEEEIKQNYFNNEWCLEILDYHKIISRLLHNKNYEFKIDMDLYNNKIDANVRKIIIPNAVITTLVNQGMAISINTHIGEYIIPASSISHYSNKLSATTPIIIELKTINTYDSNLSEYPNLFLSGESLLVYSNSKQPLEKFDGYIQVKLKSKDTYNLESLSAKLYNQNTQKWEKQGQSIGYVPQNHISFKTDIPTSYGIYTSSSFSNPNSSNFSMTKIQERFNIIGLGTRYTKSSLVKKSEYVNILMGIAENKEEINPSSVLTSNLLSKAKDSGIFISKDIKSNLNEETMVHGLIKLYELKTGKRVKVIGVYNVKNVSDPYKESVQKAFTLGLISSINPTKTVSYEIFLDLLIQII